MGVTTSSGLQAATKNWVAGSGNWNSAASWSTGTIPTAADSAQISHNDGVSRSVTYDYTGSAVTLSQLVLDLTGGAAGSTSTDGLVQAANTLWANYEYIGVSGRGEFDQSGGSNTIVNSLLLGQNYGAIGTYTLSSGTLATGYEYVGYSGGGSVNQSGGSNSATSMFLGNLVGSRGSYTLVAGTFSAATSVGQAGTGTFSQNGGTANISVLQLGNAATGTGDYELSNGNLNTAQGMKIGLYGSGTVHLTGGTVTTGTNYNDSSISPGLIMGQYAQSTSNALNIDGGIFNSTIMYIGYAGSGSVHQTAGAVNTGSTLNNGIALDGIDMGYNAGSKNNSYTLDGGTLNSRSSYIGFYGGGSFKQTGGTFNAGGMLAMGSETGSSGSYTMTGGNIVSTGTINVGAQGYGIFTQTGGTIQGDSLNVGFTATSPLHSSMSVSGQSTVSLSGGLNVENGVYTQSSGSLTGFSLFVDGATAAASVLNIGGSTNATFTLATVGESQGGTINQTGGTASYGMTLQQVTLTLGDDSGSSGIYNLSAGTVAAPDENVGYAGTGVFNQSGGVNTTTWLTIGKSSASIGSSYNLSGNGSLKTVQEDVNGAITQADSSLNTATLLQVGVAAKGSYQLSGGTLSPGSETVGVGGAGSFVQNGGSNTSTTLYIAASSSAPGSYTLNGGSINVQAERVGNGGTATFSQTGGTNTITGTHGEYLTIAPASSYTLSGTGTIRSLESSIEGTFIQNGGTLDFNPLSVGGNLGSIDVYDVKGSTASYTLNNGVLTGSDLDVNQAIGSATFTQNGGTVTLTNVMQITGKSKNAAVYNLAGGSLNGSVLQWIGSNFSSFGTFNQSGGINSTQEIKLGNPYGGFPVFGASVGNYALSGGELSTAKLTIIDSGTFTQTGGMFDAGSAVTVDNNAIATFKPSAVSGSAVIQLASLTFAGNGRLNLQSTGRNAAVFDDGSLSSTSTSTVDLTRNDMIVRSGNLTQVEGLIRSGYAAGAWNGSGITASSAATDAPYALGYLLNNDGAGKLLHSSFDSQVVSASDVLIKYTLDGDLRLDGTVDLSDFDKLASDFGDTNQTWAGGDLNYDGSVDLSDFVLFAQGFGKSQGATADAWQPLLDFAFNHGDLAAVQAIEAASVPEPGFLSMAAIATTGIALARRRRIIGR